MAPNTDPALVAPIIACVPGLEQVNIGGWSARGDMEHLEELRRKDGTLESSFMPGERADSEDSLNHVRANLNEEELDLSEKTIAHHLTRIFNKTASENRAAAAAFAIRHGLA